jgi:hypothetical protein
VGTWRGSLPDYAACKLVADGEFLIVCTGDEAAMRARCDCSDETLYLACTDKAVGETIKLG